MLGMFLYVVLTVYSSRFFPLESESRTLSVRALLFYTLLSIVFIDGLFFSFIFLRIVLPYWSKHVTDQYLKAILTIIITSINDNE